jgi:murein L,D-transpeptidase YcbB/YkuD
LRPIAALVLTLGLTAVGLVACSDTEPSTRAMPSPADPTRTFVERLLPQLDAQLRLHAEAVATASALQKYLEIEAGHSWDTRVAGGIKYADLFIRLYPERTYHKAFARSDGLTPRGEVVLEILLDSERHALNSSPYHVARIQNLVAQLKRMSAGEPAWRHVELSGAQANRLVNWLHSHGLDPSHPATRRRLLSALVGASVRAEGAENAQESDESRVLTSPAPRITAQMGKYLDAFKKSAKLTAELELRVADGALRYARDMRHFNLVRKDWRDFRDAGGSTAIIYKRLEKTFGELSKASADGARAIMAALQPSHPQYQKLLDVLARYRAIAAQGGWERVRRTSLALGARSSRVADLRERLAIEGFLPQASSEPAVPAPVDAVQPGQIPDPQPHPVPRAEERSRPTPPDPTIVDERLISAVKDYQSTHQFRPDGDPESGFWRSLNVPITRRIEQIELTIQRWRESQYAGEEDFIMVNIPDFHAQVFQDGERVMRFRVVTGDNKRVCDPETGKWTYPRATPVMMSELDHLIINPYWYVPQSIITNELRPKMERDPDYLKKNGYEIVNLHGRETIRQIPSPDNALGVVKFIFPNPDNIYMHDTPAKRYFDYPVRAFSHGCVRVHEPQKLAHYLLEHDPNGKQYDAARLIEAGEQEYIELERKIPVFIEYRTVRVDEQGRANFLADIYGRDRLRLIEDPKEREELQTCQVEIPASEQDSAAWQDEHATELPEGVEPDLGP